MEKADNQEKAQKGYKTLRINTDDLFLDPRPDP